MSSKKRWVTPSFDSFTSDNVTQVKKPFTSRKRAIHQTGSRVPFISASQNKSVTWLEKYQPQNPDDLVIHNKKLKEVEDWFKNYVARNSCNKYLILNGPCGCGKTTVLRVIAKQFNFSIVEWITPLDRDYNSDLISDDQNYQNAVEIFDQFLSRATRYPSLLSTMKLKLILVKDFPNIFLQNSDTLHDIVRKFALINTCPIVFVCNDDIIARNLFPETLRKECNMQTINFNPVHCKAVIKAMQRILELERTTLPSNINLDHIYQSSGGDLRSAILKLYFNIVKLDNETEKDKVTTTCNEKDENVDLFKLLGRVLYSKRNSGPDGYKFEHDPNDILDAVSIQPVTFVGFLRENYISRFSDINSVSNAANKLSYADILLTQHNKETNMMGVAFAIRGLMVENNKPAKSFKPFVKPRFYEEGLTSISNDIYTTFPEFQHSHRDIILHTLPLLDKSSYVFDDSQKKIVNRLLATFRK